MFVLVCGRAVARLNSGVSAGVGKILELILQKPNVRRQVNAQERKAMASSQEPLAGPDGARVRDDSGGNRTKSLSGKILATLRSNNSFKPTPLRGAA